MAIFVNVPIRTPLFFFFSFFLFLFIVFTLNQEYAVQKLVLRCAKLHTWAWLAQKVWSAQKLSGALGPLSFNIWGPNYSKALQGPMGYKCTKFVNCGYCSFLAKGGRRKRLWEEKEKEETKQQEENIYALFHRHR